MQDERPRTSCGLGQTYSWAMGEITRGFIFIFLFPLASLIHISPTENALPLTRSLRDVVVRWLQAGWRAIGT